ncbi:MAG: hypothetical protein HPY69_15440 [Armatimonadetes bacterium]|nr:hypothetical protein [Armatimonadota bacterium]
MWWHLYTGIGLLFSGAILLGWATLIVVGALSLRSGQRGLGTVFIVIGGLWGLVVLIGGGYAYYALRDVQSGSSTAVAFDPQTHQGPTGTLTLNWKQPSTLNVRSKQGKEKYKLETKDGTFKLPPGTYAVESWSAKVTDSKGISWVLETRYPRNLQSLEVKADSTTQLALGPPLEASVLASAHGGSASFGFVLKDAAGNDYTMVGSGKGAQPPGFEVTDETDKVVWSGKFEYG